MFGLMAPVVALGQQVAVHPDEGAPLSRRVDWALQEGGPGGFWVGYSISKYMHEGSWMGRIGGRDWSSRKSLYALLGKEHLEEALPPELKRELGFTSDGVIHIDRPAHTDVRILKEVGVLVYFAGRTRAPVKIQMSNMSLGVALDEKPLFWLGKAADEESTDYLKSLFGETGDEALQADVLRAVALHENRASNFNFIAGVVTSDADEELREDAVFWMGQLDLPQGLALLKDVVAKDRSMDVREKAVFAIHQMTSVEAQELLIDLARHATPREVQKQAIFWLGQQASEKATALLEEILYDEADTEVQEHAVHALAQMPAEKSIPKLIEIAHTHPSVSVRKKAIFWLGDSGDPRAVEVLVEMVKGAN